jgi:glutamine amidotransferase
VSSLLQLPKHVLTAPSNNHPFVWGRYSFMHNGAIGNFSELRVPLLNKMSLPAQQHINGTTDSEHFAMLFFSCLADRVGTHGPAMLDQSWALADMKAALEQALTTLFAVQRDVVGAERIERSSLNVAVTDGEQLLAMRFRNAGPDEFPPSLYYTTTAGVILNRKYAGDPDHPDKSVWNSRLNAQPRSVESHGKHVIVASEPTTYHDEDWKLIDKNHCIMVGRDMEPSVVPIDVSF